MSPRCCRWCRHSWYNKTNMQQNTLQPSYQSLFRAQCQSRRLRMWVLLVRLARQRQCLQKAVRIREQREAARRASLSAFKLSGRRSLGEYGHSGGGPAAGGPKRVWRGFPDIAGKATESFLKQAIGKPNIQTRSCSRFLSLGSPHVRTDIMGHLVKILRPINEKT